MSSVCPSSTQTAICQFLASVANHFKDPIPFFEAPACQFVHSIIIQLYTFQSADITDFMIDSLLESDANRVEVFLGPAFPRSCFTITAVDDDIPEEPRKVLRFVIPSGEGLLPYQISTRASFRSVRIIDNDCEC